jgi:polar amino acid transport system permease protein
MPALIKGAALTVQITLMAGSLAFAISIFVGLLRGLPSPFIRVPTTIYVEFFRGTSAFVQIYWAYFVLPHLGVRLSAIEAGTLVLALNVGAYGSEVIRGALSSIHTGQREACLALNLPRWSAFRRILLPQAMLRAIMPMGNLLIDLLKGTSLLSAITVTDLSFAGRQSVSALGHPMTIFGLVLLMYFVMAAPLAWCFSRADRYFRRSLSTGDSR